MWVKRGLVAAALLGLLTGAANRGSAQEPPQAPRRAGGFVPGQQRPPGDPAQIARGKTLYGINCRGCHGADLRGGDMGGPNLLRSQVALSDLNGELIVPIIQGSRKDMGMPAIRMSDPRRKSSGRVRSQRDGDHRPAGHCRLRPAGSLPACSSATPAKARRISPRSALAATPPTGDLQGIASKISDPKTLQNTWVAGGGAVDVADAGGGRAERRHSPTVTVTLPSGENVEGQLRSHRRFPGHCGASRRNGPHLSPQRRRRRRSTSTTR